MTILSDFSSKVINTIKKIPKGKVATYKQIAVLSGKTHASRGVAWILHSCSESHNLPWHRVLNSQGKISFPPASKQFRTQKRKLEKEGVEFEKDQIDLKKFQWEKKPSLKKSGSTGPRMFSTEDR